MGTEVRSRERRRLCFPPPPLPGSQRRLSQSLPAFSLRCVALRVGCRHLYPSLPFPPRPPRLNAAAKFTALKATSLLFFSCFFFSAPFPSNRERGEAEEYRPRMFHIPTARLRAHSLCTLLLSLILNQSSPTPYPHDISPYLLLTAPPPPPPPLPSLN